MKSTRWSIGRRILLALGIILAPRILSAAALEKPDGLSVDASSSRPSFSWNSVDDAGLYRVAVFDEPDAEGKRLLLAAVWVSGTAWAYGDPPSVKSADRLPSTRPLQLSAGHKVRVMVASARADGTDKSDWSGADFKVAAQAADDAAAEALPTASPSPTMVAAQALSPGAGAELDLSGGDEFKTSPDPTVIDVGDNSRTADAGVSALSPTGSAVAGAAATAAIPDSATGSAATTATAAAPAGEAAAAATVTDPEAAAKALLAAGKYEDAEAAFRALLDQNGKDAAAWEGLGDSYAGRSMKVEAASAYEKALQLNASNERLKQWMQKNVRY